MDAATARPRADRAPRHVTLFSPVAKALLAARVPLGFNGLITIRGRTSGLPRTTPVAIIEVDGRRWIWAPWGDVHWVRNLRAAGGATITVRGRKEEVRATELDQPERLEFFRDVLGPVARGIPFGAWFIRVVDGVDLADPLEASEGRPVFELHPSHDPRRPAYGTSPPETETGPEGPASVRSRWWAILDSNQ